VVCIQAVFEGAMYTFVFLWTPALSPNGEHIPHGFIFALFMLASMAGSAIAGHLLASNQHPEQYMQVVFLLGSACMCVPVLFYMSGVDYSDPIPQGITWAGKMQLLSFCVFEVCIGLFWPSMMRMRAHYLPDELRATLINCFRIPLNLFVCVVLYNVKSFPLGWMFLLCAVFMLIAYAGCRRFDTLIAKGSKQFKEGQESLSTGV
jgi:MFS transporter, MFS domain-containing protein family, molybdate-anion transporter